MDGIGKTGWDTLTAVTFEDRGMAGTNRHYRLPAGRALMTVQCALDAYGQPA